VDWILSVKAPLKIQLSTRIHMKIMFLSGRIAEIEGTLALRVTNSVRLAAG